jgi:hypothetical protein
MSLLAGLPGYSLIANKLRKDPPSEEVPAAASGKRQATLYRQNMATLNRMFSRISKQRPLSREPTPWTRVSLARNIDGEPRTFTYARYNIQKGCLELAAGDPAEWKKGPPRLTEAPSLQLYSSNRFGYREQLAMGTSPNNLSKAVQSVLDDVLRRVSVPS